MKFKDILKAGPKKYKASLKLLSLMEKAKQAFEQGGELVHQDYIDLQKRIVNLENYYINIQDGNVVKDLDPKQPGEQIRVMQAKIGSTYHCNIIDMCTSTPEDRIIARAGPDGKTFEYIRQDYKTLPTNRTIANILNLLKIPTNEVNEGIRHIDNLLQTPDLDHQAEKQLNYIKMHTAKMITNGYDMLRIAVKNGFVTIDGWGLPIKTMKQTYGSMINDPKNKTYLQYAEALFEMAGAMMGETRDKPLYRDQIQDGTVDGSAMLNRLNTPKNTKILTKLRKLIGFNGYIPIGIDSDNIVAYADGRSSGSEFFRRGGVFDNFDCLVPSIGYGPQQGPAYIDDLLQTPGLHPEATVQLNQIKIHTAKMIKNGYDMSRIAVENGFVTIDGWGLPIEPINQTYNSMKNDPKGKTYPQYAEALFEMAGAMIGETRVRPSHRDQIQDGTVDGAAMLNGLNTPKNTKILTKLRKLIGFNGSIPMGLDSDKKVIYANVRSSVSYFNRYDVNINIIFLVPSIVCDPHR